MLIHFTFRQNYIIFKLMFNFIFSYVYGLCRLYIWWHWGTKRREYWMGIKMNEITSLNKKVIVMWPAWMELSWFNWLTSCFFEVNDSIYHLASPPLILFKCQFVQEKSKQTIRLNLLNIKKLIAAWCFIKLK